MILTLKQTCPLCFEYVRDPRQHASTLPCAAKSRANAKREKGYEVCDSLHLPWNVVSMDHTLYTPEGMGDIKTERWAPARLVQLARLIGDTDPDHTIINTAAENPVYLEMEIARRS